MRIGLLLIAFSLFSLSDLDAQLLNGRVLNEYGGMASDVNVQFLNKENRITTDRDGRFRILASKLPDTLVFSAEGYEPYKVIITEKNIKDVNFEVVLLNKRSAMHEVMVAGASPKMDALGAGSGTKVYSGKSYRLKPADVKSGEVLAYSPVTYTSGIMTHSFYFKDTTRVPRDGMLAKSKVLTAGEVNDFTKWKMWSDYTNAEFKTFSKSWNLCTAKRYSVQVMDRKHQPVINEPVFLINKKTKDTTWKTYTDNTGKAELWGSMFDSTATAEYLLAVKNERNNNPAEFSNGINNIVINSSCNFSKDVDIAFVVDATGSMGDEIEFLKLELEDVIANTMEKYKSLSLRMASVFYRDRGDEYLTKHVDFHDDLLKTMNFIKLQQAGGGGDHPEAVDHAFQTALDSLKWNTESRIRLMFLILDAPPHNSAKKKMETMIAKAAAMGIHVIPIACSGTDKSTEFFLRSIALATNGTYAFLTNHSGVGNKHIEPTTDKYSVELLNNLMQRMIAQYLYAGDCETNSTSQTPPDIVGYQNVSGIKIYPNPTDGRFTIESRHPIKELFVADFAGKILIRLNDQNGKSGRQKWQVDISQYASGTYLVKYITEDNKWGSEKVILIH